MAYQVKYYKPGQGTIVRWSAFALVALLVLFGCHSLYRVVGTDWWENALLRVPILDFGVTTGFLISFGLAAAGCFAAYVFVVNGSRPAEFLIETEGELKKVNWPPRHEFLGSSFIVILSVVIISLYLMFVDKFLELTVNQLILR